MSLELLSKSTNPMHGGHVKNINDTIYDSIPSYGATNNQINNTFTSNDIEAFGKSIVLGGIDGITASYIAIATLVGARLTLLHILILGFANTFGNALSVGVSEYYSSKSHREFIQVEKRRAIWQYKNFREDEIREMVKRLSRKGMSIHDAELVVNKFALYEDIFINLLMVEELGMSIPEEDDGGALADSFFVFFSFGIFGSFPLIPFIIGIFVPSLSIDILFMLSSLIAIVILFILGGIKSSFSSTYWFCSAIESVVTSVICVAIAYTVSYAGTDYLSDYIYNNEGL